MYSIGQVAEMFGLPISTLRYYEKRGIIGPLARRTGVRVFSEEDLKLLQIVQCLKKTGMPIEEIRQFAELIRQGVPQSERLLRLNASAKQMMQSLTNDHRIEAFKEYGTLPHESE